MNTTASVNDINQCLAQAHLLAKRMSQPQRKEHSLAHVFTTLAGDETTGLLAFAIWRGRSRLISSLRNTASIRYDGVTRVRHART
jgi:hypothetical protein